MTCYIPSCFGSEPQKILVLIFIGIWACLWSKGVIQFQMLITSSFEMEIHRAKPTFFWCFHTFQIVCCKPKYWMTISLPSFLGLKGIPFRLANLKMSIWVSFCYLHCYQHLGRGDITFMMMYLYNCNVSCNVTLLHSMITYGNG